jgi:hypothetical protein
MKSRNAMVQTVFRAAVLLCALLGSAVYKDRRDQIWKLESAALKMAPSPL